jgi:ferredoxin
MDRKYINKDYFKQFLFSLLDDFVVYAPFFKGEDYFLDIVSKDNMDDVVFNNYRVIEPIKTFFSPVKEKLVSDNKTRKIVIFGLKSCDLAHLDILNRVFLFPEYVDEFYKNRLENTIIVSSDCDGSKDVCFCNSVGTMPYPQKGFDLNLSSLDAGFIIEIGSSNGEKIINRYKKYFDEVDKKDIVGLEKKRTDFAELMDRKTKKFEGLIKNKDVSFWKETAEKCVECSACRFVCGSCYCFLLIEHSNKDFLKEKSWDSCQFSGYWRVAGNPHAKPKEEKFKNFFQCKFEFRKQNFSMFACSGCGRCIEACHGDTLKDTFKKL